MHAERCLTHETCDLEPTEEDEQGTVPCDYMTSLHRIQMMLPKTTRWWPHSHVTTPLREDIRDGLNEQQAADGI